VFGGVVGGVGGGWCWGGGGGGGGGGEAGSNMMIQNTPMEAEERCLGRGGLTGRRGRAVEGLGTPDGPHSRVQCGLKGQSAGTTGGR